MDNVLFPLWIIAAHLAGDYIIQNDWMATNKKGNWWPLTVHIATYMLFFVPLLWVGLSPLQFILIAAQHAAQDYTNFVYWFMNKTGKIGLAKPPLGPWGIIATDNSFHLVSIVLILTFVP